MNNRFLLFILILVFSQLSVCHVTNGQDYRSHQSGNWNDPLNWEKNVSGSWSYPAPEFPPISSLSSRVTIRNGHTITATSNITGASGGVLEIEEGGTLNMGSWYVRGSGLNPRFPTVIINGILSTSSYINSATFSLGSSGHFITAYYLGTGWWNGNTLPTSYVLDGIMEFNGSGTQIIPEYNYVNLIASGTGTKNMSGTIIISGSFRIEQTAIVYLTDCFLFINGNGAGIINEGSIGWNFTSLYFEDGTQTFTGEGTFSGTVESFSVGESFPTTVTFSVQDELTINNMTVHSGSSLTLGQGTKVTVNSSLTTNNALTLDVSTSAPYTTASLIVSPSASLSGSTTAKLYLTGGGDEGTYKWHYISSPFATVGTGAFTAVTQDLAQYVESRVNSNLMQGWVASDGYIYATGAMGGPTFGTLSPGKGYNFWDGTNNMITISGALNKSNQTVSLSYTERPLSGYNLLGNPFSSGLNWDNIANGTYFTYPANTSRAVHFTRDNEMCTYVNGVGTPGDVTGIIPPMQGFFVRTAAAGNSITIPADARTHSSIHQRYKGSAAEIPLIRLVLYENDAPEDETVVRFDELAKPEFDYDFDAGKMFLNATKTTIHTAIGGTNFTINGLPFPAEGVVTEIPVVINLPASGTHKIEASQIQALDLYDIALRDNLAGTTTDLRTTPEVIFVSTSGLVSDRFTLLVGDNLMTGIEDPFSGAKAFSIYNGFGFINIMPLSDEWNGSEGSVRMIDMTGKCLFNMTDAEFRKNTLLQIEAPQAKGIYIVEIKSGVKRFTGKIVLK